MRLRFVSELVTQPGTRSQAEVGSKRNGSASAPSLEEKPPESSRYEMRSSPSTPLAPPALPDPSILPAYRFASLATWLDPERKKQPQPTTATQVGTNGPGGTRTHDQRIKSPLLYRLSYRPSKRETNAVRAVSQPNRTQRRHGRHRARGVLGPIEAADVQSVVPPGPCSWSNRPGRPSRHPVRARPPRPRFGSRVKAWKLRREQVSRGSARRAST